tara:strand:+ start:253 stop:927 length:675 start_codon:yes stop_codon:yes gene_type:complete
MKIFVLSLDNETGKNRRNKINYNYELIWGTSNLLDLPEDFKNKITKGLDTRTLEKNKPTVMRRRGCPQFSYLKILQKIVDENIYNVIICEDDAILKNENLLNNLENLNINEPVLLNAKLHHPVSYEFDKDFDCKNIKFNNGLNEINYNLFRWSCCACIYYPTPQSAKYILDYINNTDKLTYFDLQLSKKKIIKYLYYPAVFLINDDGVSQIDKPSGLIDNYSVS